MEQFMDDLAERVAEKLARRQRNVLFAPPPPPPRSTYHGTVYDGCGSSKPTSSPWCGSPRTYDSCGLPRNHDSGRC